MYTKKISSLAIIFMSFLAIGQFDNDKLLTSNQTPTYEETISFYKDLSDKTEGMRLFNMGDSDYGLPIYLCVLNYDPSNEDSLSIFESARQTTTLLINNAIHPGEPCGVNASMKLALDFAEMSEAERKTFPLIGIIPAYNIGGMKNRGAHSRANQEGPELHGFRGNASNLDLNRDFVKMDSKNMFTFAKIFHSLDPDVFIDTHTSNGANYQYTLTYITPIMEKLAPSIRSIFEEDMIPSLKRSVDKNWGYDLFPYVNLKGRTPKEGMVKFNATPRYSMGYTDLFHTISFTTETHMLKPFPDRVKSTYGFLIETAKYSQENSKAIEKARVEAFEYDQQQRELPVNFKLDSIPESIDFKEFEWTFEASEITTGKRLKYHEDQPSDMTIPYFLNYSPTDSVLIPDYFVVGRQAFDVIERLKANNVAFRMISKDTLVSLKKLKVVDYSTLERPYEGHFLHRTIQYETIIDSVQLKRGDILIKTDQSKRRFLAKLLSPEYVDSYFSWNFFDSYLQQKEHFSSYVFEEIATKLLEDNTELKATYEKKLEQDSSFAESRYQQLNFIYRNSPHYEDHGVLPVYLSIDE